jgi:hypothetical protein
VIPILHRLYYLEKTPRELSNRFNESINRMSISDIRRTWYRVYHGDARNLDKIEYESIDLVATHLPYLNIISYREKDRVEGDMSKTQKSRRVSEVDKRYSEKKYKEF